MHVHLLRQEQDATLMAFTRTHLQPMSTDMALKVMNHPLNHSFNMTVKHGMLKDMEGFVPLEKVNRCIVAR